VFLVALVCAAALLVYLHYVGLPDWITGALLRQVRKQGVALECGRVVLRWYDGVVAQNVALGAEEEGDGMRLTLPEVALRFDTVALLHGEVAVRALDLRDGCLVLPLGADEEGMSMDRMTAELRFNADDTWVLESASAQCLGVNLHLQAHLSNASALGSWQRGSGEGTPFAWEGPLRGFVRQVKQLRFGESPDLSLELRGDAGHPETMSAVLRLQSRGADTPWGGADVVLAAFHLNEGADLTGLGRFRLQLEARGLKTAGWGDLGRLRLESEWFQTLTNPVPSQARVDLELEGVETPWGNTGLHLAGTGRVQEGGRLLDLELALAGGALEGVFVRSEQTDLRVHLLEDLDTLLPRTGEWSMDVQAPEFAHGVAKRLRLEGNFEHAPHSGLAIPGDLPAGLLDWRAGLSGTVTGFRRNEVEVDELRVRLDWDAPALRVSRLEADFDQRQLQLEAGFDLSSRRLDSTISLDFDVHRLDPLLPAGVLAWLERYGWQKQSPPVVGARAWLTLPPFGELSSEEGKKRLGESLAVQGKLVAAEASFQGIPIETLSFDFSFTNETWRLTDFVAAVPGGRFGMAYTEDQRTREYRFDIDAELDPHLFRSLVRMPEQQAFDFFQFTGPPRCEGFITGRYGAPETTGFSGRLRIDDFVFRGEPIEDLQAKLSFTNGVVQATGVQLRSEGTVRAKDVQYDTRRQLLTLDEARSTIPPMRVARAIGKQVVSVLEPYQFGESPDVLVNGSLNVRDTREANLRFDLAGGPFEWWRFELPRIQGSVLWTNQAVRLRDLDGQFYGGRVKGDVDVDMTAEAGADLRFEARFDQVDFAALMDDLIAPTNRLEGRLQGIWTLTHANSDDWGSWNGLGRVELRDGYLWDIPLLGAGTQWMQTLGVDVAKSPIRGLEGDFTMTNSVIHTRNLQLQSPAMWLAYRGTVDFAARVDARVEAQLLREAAVVGPLVSLVFSPLTKILEFKVGGTIMSPVIEPLYIPKPLLFPLNPVGVIRDIFRRPERPKDDVENGQQP
jgi:hypothetical protein